MPTNQAAWITAKQAKPLEVSEAPFVKPGANEVVVKNEAIAINPVDWKIQEAGYFLEKFPNVLGTDCAGTVEEVGEGVKNYKKGDRVMAHAIGLGNQNPAYGGFQLYTIAPAQTVSHVPNNIPFTSATVLPLAINTAVTGLYPSDVLNLPQPTASPSSKPTKTIIVIGGSSSVGTVAVQLARASGYSVISTASPKNHSYVTSLGASAVFDHNSSDVVSDVTSHIQSSGTTFAGIYDAISLPNTATLALSLAAALSHNSSLPEAKRIATTLPAPEEIQNKAKAPGITFHNVFAITVVTQTPDLCKAIWWDFLPQALENGSFKALPEPQVEGKGLESVQHAVDVQKAGVSAKKVVVEL